jgi:hypothetical protein
MKPPDVATILQERGWGSIFNNTGEMAHSSDWDTVGR